MKQRPNSLETALSGQPNCGLSESCGSILGRKRWPLPSLLRIDRPLSPPSWQLECFRIRPANRAADGRADFTKKLRLSLMMAQTSKHAGALVFASSMALCLHPSHQEQGQGGSSLATREFTMYIFFSVSGKFAPRLIFCRVFHAVVPRTSPRNESGWLSQLMKFGCYQEAQCFFHNKPV